MSVKRYPFGRLPDGREIYRYELRSGMLTVSVLDYGATVQSIVFGGRDVVLGYDDLEHYLHSTCCFGSTVGRVANRIGGASFELNGRTYPLAANNGKNHLHGGTVGFAARVWDSEMLPEDDAVVFRLTSPDGEEGYPGRLRVAVIFTVTGGRLRMAYTAIGDTDTLVNLTNHTYFNLEGQDGPSVEDTVLRIHADAITVPDEGLVPTGELLPVEDTPFDLREGRRLGDGLASPHPLIRAAGGYDHNFVLGTDRAWRHAATATAPASGITMECWTDMPGVQLYTANGLDESGCKGGVTRGRHSGFCLETQYWPDAPHHAHFPSIVLPAGEFYRSRTEYRFTNR